MTSFVDWFREVFLVTSVTQTIIIIFFVCAIGLLLTKIPMGKFSLGVTFVFFAGIAVANLGVEVDKQSLLFAQNFGLVLFIYALGVQVGPSFFPSLRSGGIQDNLMGLLLVAVSLVFCWLFHFLVGLPITEMVGIMSGAVTNTPMLAAAQSTVAGIDPNTALVQSDMALACAVTYPLGVVGMIIAMIVLDLLPKPKKKQREAQHHVTFLSEYTIANPSIFGMNIAQVAKDSEFTFVVTRLWHGGTVAIPTSETVLHEGDRVLVISDEERVRSLELLFGHRNQADWNREGIDWNAIDKDLISKRIVITNKELNGERLGHMKLRSLYGVNVTRVDRAGIELLATPDLHVQLGDRMVVVGSKSAVEQAEQLIGNEVNLLDAPNLLSLFVGLLLGCVVGLIPIMIPGISFPIKLGLAGGPIIVGILMGAYGPRFRLMTYITNSASLFIRQFGIILYLCCLGLASGGNFLETLLHGNGPLWVLLGFIITLLPVVIVGFVTQKWMKKSYGETCGMLCGAMANPMVLDFLEGKVKDDSHNIAYATVYPLSMFARIITAQIMILLFF